MRTAGGQAAGDDNRIKGPMDLPANELDWSEHERVLTAVFRRGSRTYFNSTRFFPPGIRRDVYCLYAFVRTADNFVDRIPQDREGFLAFRGSYEACREGRNTAADPVITGFCETARRRCFEPAWVEAFLDSMAMDLTKTSYDGLSDTLRYVYGSAEVIGLMMASIMGLDGRSRPYARLLGRAMQYINFIRDIGHDQALGRTYFPRQAMRTFHLDTLSLEEARSKPGAFSAFIRAQAGRYRTWQSAAERGYAFLPQRCLVPVKTAADMYAWTARRIETDPLRVFAGPVKPSRLRILAAGLRNARSLKGKQP